MPKRPSVVSTPTFETRPDLYDALVDWPKRLAIETPFYRTIFSRFRVNTVLDAACGTGRHAAMFRSWNLLVEGADVSADMIARARAAYGETDELRWVQRSFDTRPPAATFDAAICVGNSLALAADLAAVERAVSGLLSAVRRGGILVVQVLNLWRLPDGPMTWQKFRRATLDGVEHLLIKGIHRAGSRGHIDLLDFAGDDAPPVIEQPTFLGLRAEALDAIARRAAAQRIEFYGDYAFNAYDERTSADLIAVIQSSENPE